MAKSPKPVTAEEVERIVLAALVREFGKRPLTEEVARQGLALAAHTLIQTHLKELGKSG